ncbi:hypothetical protein DIPPA_23879 [Diplonema papillatum]|nr:hypothetical protein DIPPA_23879 [Diplonema papillatum]
MARAAEKHQSDLLELEDKHSKTRQALSALEVEHHRMGALVSKLETDKKRLQADLRGFEERKEHLAREMETLNRQHQLEVDRLTERFATDRADLEHKVLQRDERVCHLDAENADLSQRLKKMSDDSEKERERVLRRMTEQIRVILDDSPGFLPVTR